MNVIPKLEECSRVLIVEGYSDLLFYAELLEYLGRHRSVFIKQFNGKSELDAKLETFLSPSILASKEVIGVIVDADTNASNAFNKTADTLSHIANQQIVRNSWTQGSPKIGLFVTPDGNSNGEIETLVWSAWAATPENEAQRTCITDFVDRMSAAGATAQSPDKGLVSSLLAIRNDEDPRLGPGARRKNIFDFSRPQYESLRSFLSTF
jgi:hypothetical protein